MALRCRVGMSADLNDLLNILGDTREFVLMYPWKIYRQQLAAAPKASKRSVAASASRNSEHAFLICARQVRRKPWSRILW